LVNLSSIPKQIKPSIYATELQYLLCIILLTFICLWIRCICCQRKGRCISHIKHGARRSCIWREENLCWGI